MVAESLVLGWIATARPTFRKEQQSYQCCHFVSHPHQQPKSATMACTKRESEGDYDPECQAKAVKVSTKSMTTTPMMSRTTGLLHHGRAVPSWRIDALRRNARMTPPRVAAPSSSTWTCETTILASSTICGICRAVGPDDTRRSNLRAFRRMVCATLHSGKDGRYSMYLI
jgi:hypothetical protein